MHIPEKAIEAAAKAMHERTCCPMDSASPCDQTELPMDDARTALEAAAPFIAAQAWQDGFNAGTWEEQGKAQTTGLTRIQSTPNPYRIESEAPNA